MPSDWNSGTITAQFHWTWTPGSAKETAKWYIQGISYGDSDALDAYWRMAVDVVDAGITASDAHLSAARGNITIAGTTISEIIMFQVCCDVSEDTLSGDAKLLGVMFTFTRM